MFLLIYRLAILLKTLIILLYVEYHSYNNAVLSLSCLPFFR